MNLIWTVEDVGHVHRATARSPGVKAAYLALVNMLVNVLSERFGSMRCLGPDRSAREAIAKSKLPVDMSMAFRPAIAYENTQYGGILATIRFPRSAPLTRDVPGSFLIGGGYKQARTLRCGCSPPAMLWKKDHARLSLSLGNKVSFAALYFLPAHACV